MTTLLIASGCSGHQPGEGQALDAASDGRPQTGLPAKDGATLQGERVIALSNVDLRVVPTDSGSLTFAAAIVGLRTFELLEERAGTIWATPLAAFDPPQLRQRHSPLFVWPLDVDCDGRVDLALGGLGEAYVVRALPQHGFGPREPWARYLPPGEGTGAFDQRLQVGPNLVIAPFVIGRTVRVSVRGPGAPCTWLAASEVQTTEAPVPGSFLFGWPAQGAAARLLLQERGATAQALSLAGDGGSPELRAGGAVHPRPDLPYLAPFEAIDAPVPLPEQGGCPRRALGVGRVPANATSSPRTRAELHRLQLFSFSESDYSWRDLPGTSGLVAYDVVDGGALRPTFVGVVRSTPGGHQFQLLRLTDCLTAELTATLAIEFDWRTPPAPLQGRLEAEQMDGSGSQAGFVPRYGFPTRLAGHSSEQDGSLRLTFAHYDGYDARVVEALQEAGSWTLSFRKTALHEVRDDLAFPYTATDLALERGMDDGGAH